MEILIQGVNLNLKEILNYLESNSSIELVDVNSTLGRFRRI